MPTPSHPKIYHVVHVDRLPSIIEDGYLWCDAKINKHDRGGTAIGMNHIKMRRLELPLPSYPDLHVGDCVPFYFCPRSIMLFVLYKDNLPELSYHGGQTPIVHLEADLRKTVDWAKRKGQRWVFTLSNAGARSFEDRHDLNQLDDINWDAVQTWAWKQHQDSKQAEFLIEREFPWHLVSRIGVLSPTLQRVRATLQSAAHKPDVKIKPEWYYLTAEESLP